MSSTSSSLHCAAQLVASQFERTIRVAGDPPAGPAGPAGPGGPASPAVPGGPAGPGSPFSQPTRPTDNVIAIRARYRRMAFPQRMASLGVLGNNYAEFPAGAAAGHLIGRACSRFETKPRRAAQLRGIIQGPRVGPP